MSSSSSSSSSSSIFRQYRRFFGMNLKPDEFKTLTVGSNWELNFRLLLLFCDLIKKMKRKETKSEVKRRELKDGDNIAESFCQFAQYIL